MVWGYSKRCCSIAIFTRPTAFLAPSFLNKFLRCVSTVFTERCNVSAICAVEYCALINRKTSSWR